MTDLPARSSHPALLVLRRIGSVLLSLAAIVLAVVLGALVFAYGLNLGLAPAIILGAVVLFAVAWLLTALAHKIWRSPRSGPRLPLRRRKSPLIVAGALLTVVGVVAGTTILAPVPDEPTVEEGRPDPSYWDLSTGSRIAYWHFPAGDAEPDATPIIFVHGGPGGYASGGTIEHFEQLAEFGQDVYVYDQAGAGLSPNLPLDEFTVERTVADLLAIQETIGSAKIDLIGHSAGGYVVEAYTAAHADRVEHVALISPGSYDPGAEMAADIEAEWEALEEKDSEAVQTIDDNSPPLDLSPRAFFSLALRELIGYGASENAMSQEDSKRIMSQMLAPLNLHANIALGEDFAATWPDTIDGLESASTPTLLIRAEYDYVTWVEQQPYAEANSQFEAVYIEDAFHGPWDKQPDSVNDALDAFFDDRPQPGGVYEGSRNPLLEDATGVRD
jgi:proline iminopeptidase